MPSFSNPFASTSSKSNKIYSLFEIRLDNDFIVFRGNAQEASGQSLRGSVVLCLKEQVKVEDIHLRLTGNCRIAWLDGRHTPSGINNQKIDRTTPVLRHDWKPFVGGSNHHHVLAPGNYQWPFDFELPGDTPESVEGLHQTGITYALKATISRGKIHQNYHATKRFRIIRTLAPSALELNHSMSVENVWANKIEYTVVIPQKAVVFGTGVPLEMRFSPLLKGLEMGNIVVKMFESQEFTVSGPGTFTRTHKNDREVKTWTIEVTREKHWNDMIEETGQEGWVVKQDLPLPKRLNSCIQDCVVQGIKVRHKLKLTVALNNPDGHVSELRATLPVTVFISPNMPLDDDGNLVAQLPSAQPDAVDERGGMAPPGYGQHVLDQLYDGVDISGIMTPGVQSGPNTPFYGHSRAGSSENLAAIAHGSAVTPAALSSRLQNMSLDESHRGRFHTPHDSGSGAITPYHPHDNEHATDSSLPHSAELSRRTSEEENPGRSGHGTPPTQSDYQMEELSKVPSYTTAIRTRLDKRSNYPSSRELPNYDTATGAPSSPSQSIADPMETMTEGCATEAAEASGSGSGIPRSSNRGHVHGFSFLSPGWPLPHRSTL